MVIVRSLTKFGHLNATSSVLGVRETRRAHTAEGSRDGK